MRLFGTNGRLLRSVAALCLPTVCVIAFSIYFFVNRIPEIEKAERARVRAVYRETALEIRQSPGMFTPLAEGLPKEWRKAAGRMAPGKWGYQPMSTNGTTVVWYAGEGGAFATTVPLVRPTDYRVLFETFGSVFLFVLIGMTGIGIRYFVEYVRTRDDFLAATAHDLTTPLVGMRYAIGRNDEDARTLNERMIRLVTNIKDFLRLGGRRPRPRADRIDLARCCAEAYALFREDYRDVFDGADVPIECEGESGVFAEGDETLTVQILWNLFGNDLKYAAPHGAVRVRIAAADGFAVVEFADEGKGMTPRQMRRAFDRYYRAKTVLDSGKGGFGIGLCTAREFAEAMGGSLTVRANRPHGCVFTLSLPVCPTVAPENCRNQKKGSLT